MDSKIQSFLELTAKNDLVQLVADKRAAWLWSSDGARLLWANAAGASFFSAHSVSDLAGLASLERSPARPHIARIADSGPQDKFSIDRLRFYRGLRVMLLTCQCKRLQLDNGETAALIVCGDKGLSTTKDPLSTFAQLIASETATVFLTSHGDVTEKVGQLTGNPEDLELPDGQTALFGPLELNGTFHEGAVLELEDSTKLIVLENDPVGDDDAAPADDASDSALLAAGAAGAAVAAAASAASLTSVADATRNRGSGRKRSYVASRGRCGDRLGQGRCGRTRSSAHSGRKQLRGRGRRSRDTVAIRPC